MTAPVDARVPSPRAPLTGEELGGALARGLVEAVFQPVVEVASGRVVAVEALARLRHPVSGQLLRPDAFLALAEATDVVHVVDRLVAAQAVALAAEARAARPGVPFSAAVNVSVSHLDREGVAEHLLRLCARHGLPPNALVVEVTEQVRSEEGRGHEQALAALAAAGVNVTIDDFGVGWAGFSYVVRFPVRGVKLDRSLTQALAAGGRPARVVRALVGLADDVGLHVVAEGVETEVELDAVREAGCGFVQGYLLSRPLPAAAVLDLVRRDALLLP